MQYLILSKDQAKELLAEIAAMEQEAFKSGYEAARDDEAEKHDDAEMNAYDEGFEHGNKQGYDEGYNDGAGDSYDDGFEHGNKQGYDEGYNDGAGDSYDDGYDDGYASGYSEAELRAAESAAFDEPPRIHNWTEGTSLAD